MRASTAGRKLFSRRKPSFRPLIERLEERLAPAAFTVNTTMDTVAADLNTGLDANGNISLRSAVQAANFHFRDANAINLPAGTYRLTIPGQDEDDAATGDLDVKNDLTINGASAATTIVDANGLDRAFQIFFAYTVSISNVTVENGRVLTTGGGGISNAGSLTLSDSIVTSNTEDGSLADQLAEGGGILNVGTLTLLNDSISSNFAKGAFGIGTGHAGTAGGGGLFNGGISEISGCTFADNHALAGMADFIEPVPGFRLYGTDGDALGGAILTGGTMHITASTISNNATNGSGAYEAAFETRNEGGGIYNSGDLNLSTSSITNNQAVVTLVVPGNMALRTNIFGGGIFNEGGQLTISDSVVSNNHVPGIDGESGRNGTGGSSGSSGSDGTGAAGAVGGNGGAATGGYAGSLAAGGGLYLAGGSATLQRSTFSQNVATGGAGGYGGDGGAGGNGGNGGSGTSGGVGRGGNGGSGGHGGAGGAGGVGGAGGLAFGGAIYNLALPLSVIDCTFFGNKAIAGPSGSSGHGGNGGAGGSGGNGGGGVLQGSGGAGGNGGDGGQGGAAAGAAAQGGAIYDLDTTAATISESTLFGNQATSTLGSQGAGAGGGTGGTGGSGPFGTTGAHGPDGSQGATGAQAVALSTGGGVATGQQIPSVTSFTKFSNTIAAGNLADQTPDASGTSISAGCNLIGNGTGSSGFSAVTDHVGNSAAPLDPKLGPLQDNGGPTQTMALLAGSPAIGTGDPALALTLDQRGVRRVGAVDIGATAYYVWHNLVHDIDVDGNGHLAPNDALNVINVINAHLLLSGLTKNPSTGPMYLDVNNDGFLFPNDALIVINNINAHVVLGTASLALGGEGEGAQGMGENTRQAAGTADDLLLLLALDVGSQSDRKTR